jgi:hypothetical protein
MVVILMLCDLVNGESYAEALSDGRLSESGSVQGVFSD